MVVDLGPNVSAFVKWKKNHTDTLFSPPDIAKIQIRFSFGVKTLAPGTQRLQVFGYSFWFQPEKVENARTRVSPCFPHDFKLYGITTISAWFTSFSVSFLFSNVWFEEEWIVMDFFSRKSYSYFCDLVGNFVPACFLLQCLFELIWPLSLDRGNFYLFPS